MILVATVATCALVTYLFIGVFCEREWPDDLHLFVKHRPSLKMVFIAPKGESSDQPLRADQMIEESAYVEFVEEGGGWKRSLYIPWVRLAAR